MTKKSLNEKIAELDTLTNWFYGEEFSLDQATEKYKAAVTLAKEIEEDLKNLKNEITIIDKDFKEE
ncbi:exodeoxyribonuclease VII small subunit [Candidatus Saccharibacteria bacterium]|nr:exodeoxyribonuclease VII small subunit [Candidatus Saccharibacteria bacterium]